MYILIIIITPTTATITTIILIVSITKFLAPVVRKVDNAIHWINYYPADSVVCFVNIHPLDSDLFSG